MAFQPCTHIVRAEIRYVWAGQHCENVIHVFRGGGWNDDLLATLGGIIIAPLRDNLNLFPPTLQFTEVVMRDLTIDEGITRTEVFGAPNTGTFDGNSLPNNVSVVMSLKTGLSGRSFHGRIYHPALPVPEVLNNVVNTSFLELIRDGIWDTMRTVINETDGMSMVVLSRRTHGVLRDEGVGTAITAIVADPTTDSQRRRLPGRGR